MRIRAPPKKHDTWKQVLLVVRCRNTRGLGSVTPQENKKQLIHRKKRR